MVVPRANPKANKVAANAANPKGTIGGGSLLAALMSILTVFHPKESCYTFCNDVNVVPCTLGRLYNTGDTCYPEDSPVSSPGGRSQDQQTWH